MWLLHTADQGDGPAAVTVYVALSTPKAEKAFNKVFSGSGAPLLMPDLIAHKGYHQKRQYSGTNQQKYETNLEDFQRTTRQLLTDLKEPESVAPDKLLGKLTRDYGELIEMVWDLETLRISMAQQTYNFVQQLNDYGRSPVATQDNNSLDYHRDRIKAANSELELMVTKGRHALEAANPVLRMAQLRTDKAQERRQLRIEALLAAVGTALALPHLLEPETTAALLGLWPFEIEGLHENGLLTESGHLIVLRAQFLIVLAFAVAAYFVVKGLLRKPR
ncbi:MAG: hypothetical protein QOI57_1998 [Rubrobacteraceae bacterium]|jgi:hypothetical protein|nr:hypothetical protein [Rubrobacteraceae bacterium]